MLSSKPQALSLGLKTLNHQFTIGVWRGSAGWLSVPCGVSSGPALLHGNAGVVKTYIGETTNKSQQVNLAASTL